MAAVFLVARRLGEPLGFELPSPSAILKASGVSRSHAYEAAAEVVRMLQSLKRRPGRPRAPAEAVQPPGDGEAVSRAVLGFVIAHPGCVSGKGTRQRYGDGFRRFLVELRAQHEAMPLEAFAQSTALPLGTLRGWLASAASAPGTPTAQSEEALTGNQDWTPSTPLRATPKETLPDSSSSSNVTATRIETVLAAYGGWCGSFRGFCEYIKRECHIQWGRDTITHVLELHGVRQVHRRGGRSPDELALGRAFQTFFPGAQWVADGMSVPVTIGNETVSLNFELQCDAFSGAFVGISIRDNEDSVAVIESFREGIATTGAAPLAELLDNKPSNHTPEVDAALDDTLRIRATLRRPQNKGHVEGAFGLFSTTAPPLQLDLRPCTRQIAAQLLGLVTTVWARAINHRPRKDRGGLSRAQLYTIEPTLEQIVAARKALEARHRHQELARQTLEARQRPDVRAFLDATFERLALSDPERHVRIAIARYPFDAIIAGVAIFEAKQSTGSLPEGADGRYLLGIVRNVQEQREHELVADLLLRLRRQARDIALQRLCDERDALLASERPTNDVLSSFVDRALLSECALDRTFWLNALASFVGKAPPDEREARYRSATRCIHATLRAEPRLRQQAICVLAEQLLPLA